MSDHSNQPQNEEEKGARLRQSFAERLAESKTGVVLLDDLLQPPPPYEGAAFLQTDLNKSNQGTITLGEISKETAVAFWDALEKKDAEANTPSAPTIKGKGISP